MKSLIAGATGLVGGHLLKLLLNNESVERVISIGRRPSGLSTGKLQHISMNFDTIPKQLDFSAETAFCCLGTTIKKAGSQEEFRRVDHDYVIAFARLAQRAGVKRFLVISALGADPKSKIFYNRVKGEMEASITSMGFPSSAFFRPSLLLGERAEKRLLEHLAVSLYPLYKYLFTGPLAKQRPIPAETVARAMLHYSFHPKPGPHVVMNAEMFHAEPLSSG